MIGRDGSYFTPELSLKGHYIVTGHTNDIFCNDKLQLTDIRQQIHEHLRKQGFDMICFFDYTGMLYCYDEQSYKLLARDPSRQQSTSHNGGVISADGKMGRRRRRRNETQQNTPRPANNGELNMGRLHITNAWDRITAILREKEHRCALIFSNISSVQLTVPPGVMQALQELTAVHSDRPNIAVYMFRSNALADMENFASHGSDSWHILYQSILRPIIEAEDPEDNRVITINTPNAAEVRNFLNFLRFSENYEITIDPTQIVPLSESIAYGCARNNWTLRTLKQRINEHIRRTKGATLTLENYHSVIGMSNQNTALEDLEKLIGLDNVKEEIRVLYDSMANRKGRVSGYPAESTRFLPLPQQNRVVSPILNRCLVGNPGTGKTEVARLMGRIYYETGVLPQGHLVSVSAKDLISQNVGGTAQQVSRYVQEALGGVLFIDEAYALTANNSAHGREAVDQLVNDMTAYMGQFAVVMAGYERPMKRFLQSNIGLASRFDQPLHLPDYTPSQMRDIFELFVSKDDEISGLSEELTAALDDFCNNWATDHGRDWGNAREAAKLVERMKLNAQARMGRNKQSYDRVELTLSDIPVELRHHNQPAAKNIEEVVAQIKDMIGLSNVKKFLMEIIYSKKWNSENKTPGRYVFHGPPGTGKTHVARLMGKILKQLGVLERNYVYEVAARSLLIPDPSIDYGMPDPGYQEILSHAVENARGGIFFIDEAHQLADSTEGQSLLRALVPIVEDPAIRSDTCFILAGYTSEIKNMIKTDDGLKRRFPERNHIRFDNYTASELRDLAEVMAKDEGYIASDEYLDRTQIALSRFLENPPKNYGNAGFIRDTYIPQSITALNYRLNQEMLGSKTAIPDDKVVEDTPHKDKRTLTAHDLPEAFKKRAGALGLPLPPEEDVWERLEKLVGKEDVKEFFRARKVKQAENMFYDENNAVSANFAIVGPVGSGRHTVARLIASICKELGDIDRDEMNTVSKGDLEAGYVGQTAIKTRAEISKACGGCLLVDYPSSMLPKSGTDNTFGVEALAEIAGAMTGCEDKLSVILIDTPEGLENTFKVMPSMRSSITEIFYLDDLSPAQMEELFKQKTEHSIKFEKKVRDLMSDFFINWVSQRGNLGESAASWGNGVELDKLISDLIARWSSEGGKQETDENNVPYRYITMDMFPPKLQPYFKECRANDETALDELKKLTGLSEVKEAVSAIERRIRLMGHEKASPGFYAFLGNPGVGKTKVARLMGGILRATKVLSQGHVVERTARQMAQNPSAFDNTLKMAKNGILFIDEAPQLSETVAGLDIIQRLLTTIEDESVTKNTCIILAGYADAMKRLFDSDRGLQSRFGTKDSIIIFRNYEADELMSIMDDFAKRAHKESRINSMAELDVTDEEFRNKTKQIFEMVCRIGDPDYGNARYVRNYLHDCLDCLLARLDREYKNKEDITVSLMCKLTADDIPDDYSRLIETQDAPSIIRDVLVSSEEGEPINSVNYGDRFDYYARRTVLLQCFKNGQHHGIGTGAIISQNGYVLTCAHVVEGAERIRAKVYTPEGIGRNYAWFDCTVLKPYYNDCDMALIKMEGDGFPYMSIRPEDEEVSVTEETMILGFPLGTQLNGNIDTLNTSHFEGRISNRQIVEKRNRSFERNYIDSTALHGNSGGPVISKEDGRIVGVFAGSIRPDERSVDEFNFFHPIKYFWSHFVIKSKPDSKED